MKIALPASSIPCGDVPPSRDSRQVEQDLPQEWGLFGASSPTAASRQPRSEDSRHGRGRTGAPDVVSVAVGMLGLDVHEAPLSMAETWLSYYRNEFGGSAGNTAGCGGGDGGLVGPPAAASGPDAGAGGAPALAAAPPEWQLRAVSRIRELAAQGEVSASRAFPAAGGDAAASSNGPKLAECAQLSEFVLRRIVHCVATLRGPEGREGLTQVALREYTAQMAQSVCADLAQWLEQLAHLVSLYHVHVIDLERAGQQLQQKNQDLAAELEQVRGKLWADKARVKWLQDEERLEKTKANMMSLVGHLKTDCADPKIYSQREVDEMHEQWERDEVAPLLKEIKELQEELNERRLVQKLRTQRTMLTAPSKEPEAGYLDRASVQVLEKCLAGLAERLTSKLLRDKLTDVASACSDGGSSDKLLELLESINSLPSVDVEEAHMMTVLSCLANIGEQLDGVSQRFREDNPQKVVGGATVGTIGDIVAWASETLSSALRSMRVKAAKEKKPSGWSKLRAVNKMSMSILLSKQVRIGVDGSAAEPEGSGNPSPALSRAASGTNLGVARSSNASVSAAGDAAAAITASRQGSRQPSRSSLAVSAAGMAALASAGPSVSSPLEPVAAPAEAAARAGPAALQGRDSLLVVAAPAPAAPMTPERMTPASGTRRESSESDQSAEAAAALRARTVPAGTPRSNGWAHFVTPIGLAEGDDGEDDSLVWKSAPDLLEAPAEEDVPVAAPRLESSVQTTMTMQDIENNIKNAEKKAEPAGNGGISEEEFNRRLEEMRKRIEAEMRSASLKMEAERDDAALKELEKKLREAEVDKKKFQRRIEELEKLLNQTPEGREFLAKFGHELKVLKQRDVYARLYTDAVARMQRMQDDRQSTFDTLTSSVSQVVTSFKNWGGEVPTVQHDLHGRPALTVVQERRTSIIQQERRTSIVQLGGSPSAMVRRPSWTGHGGTTADRPTSGGGVSVSHIAADLDLSPVVGRRAASRGPSSRPASTRTGRFFQGAGTVEDMPDLAPVALGIGGGDPPMVRGTRAALAATGTTLELGRGGAVEAQARKTTPRGWRLGDGDIAGPRQAGDRGRSANVATLQSQWVGRLGGGPKGRAQPRGLQGRLGADSLPALAPRADGASAARGDGGAAAKGDVVYSPTKGLRHTRTDPADDLRGLMGVGRSLTSKAQDIGFPPGARPQKLDAARFAHRQGKTKLGMIVGSPAGSPHVDAAVPFGHTQSTPALRLPELQPEIA